MFLPFPDTSTRATMQFTVTVTAQVTGNFTGTPPSQLTFKFFRPTAGGQIIDQNCGLEHSKIKTETDPFGLPQEIAPATVGEHSDVDPNLVKSDKYAAPSYYSTSELQSLDRE